MKKPLLWINSLSSALHAGLDSVVSEELRATTSNICNWSGAKQCAKALSASNDAGKSRASEQMNRKVA